MKKYKVEIERSQIFVVDVLAENIDQASRVAVEKFADIKAEGVEHYYQDDEAETSVRQVYDVSNTDDPFNP